MAGRMLWLMPLLFWTAVTPASAQTQGAPPVTQPTPGLPAGPPPQGPATGPRDNQQKPDTGTGRIAGRVVGGENGAPVRRAVVGLWAEGLREGRSATTDEGGRFEFKDLPSGRFNITAAKGGYVMMWYGQRRPFEAGRPLELTEGQAVTNVLFNLPRGGVITGRITDEFGEAVAGVAVKVMRHRYVEGRRQLVPVSGPWTVTDDLGHYRAYGLPPAEYFVSASAGPGGPFGGQMETRSGFAPTYYPGTPSASGAQRVRVTIGSEVTANFALLPARTLNVRGTATDSDGKAIANGIVMVQEGGGGRQGGMFTMSAGAMIHPDGAFSINNLTPGEYVLHVNKGGGMEFDSETAVVPITLVSEDITGLSIVTSRPARISGQVLFDGEAPPSLKPTEFNFFAAPLDPVSPMFGRAFTPKDDWTFEGAAQESPVVIRGGAQPSAWRIKSVLQRGLDVTDTGIVFRAGEQVDDVQIVMSERTSVVTGTVTADRGVPAKEYAVVIYADDPNRWGPMSRYLGAARPDQQGQFEVKGLPAGDYLALAVEYLEEGQDRDPEFLQQMRPFATSFQLHEGERKVLSLRIVADR